MSGTIILQSFHAEPCPRPIHGCVENVRAWSGMHGHAHELVGDEIADLLPSLYRERCHGRWPMMTDLARPLLMRRHLGGGADRAVWIDADVLVFAPTRFCIDDVTDHAVGREVWVSRDAKGRWRTRRQVHNAVLVFTAGSPALDFLIHATQRVVEQLERPASPQISGPKLLTTLHNLVRFPVLETAGMLSPPVLADLVAGDGPGLRRHRQALREPMAAANLCHSLLGKTVDGAVLGENLMSAASEVLHREASVTGLEPL